MKKLARRFKIATVSEEQLLSCFTGSPPSDKDTFCVDQVQIEDVPEDAFVHHCFLDIMTQKIAIVLYSDEFPEVPEGEEIPRMKIRTRRVICNQKGDIIGTTRVHSE